MNSKTLTSIKNKQIIQATSFGICAQNWRTIVPAWDISEQTKQFEAPRNQGQSSSSSSVKSRMREDADTSAQSMGRPVVGLTPGANCRISFNHSVTNKEPHRPKRQFGA